MIALTLSALACSGDQTTTSVQIRVEPASSLLDQPLDIHIAGIPVGKTALVHLVSADRLGKQWMSEAKFIADRHGNVDPVRNASIGGSYTGVQPMGLIESMQPTAPQANSGAYQWGTHAHRFTLTVSAPGTRTASYSFVRYALANGATGPQAETLATAGFVGQFWQPADRAVRQPAVLAFGGSGGGLPASSFGALLASHGYPTLEIAYFNEPGLPTTLANIPLEYFARALVWLSQQLDVDPQHIYAMGASRGSEAALLLGVHYPNLIHGVIASVPSNVSLCSYPGCAGPAWVLNGQPLPYTRQFNTVNPTDDPAAVIPVERIQGPLFLDCGGDDSVWTSCAFAQAIVARLDAFHRPYGHLLVSYPDAGHGVGILVPYAPGADGEGVNGNSLRGATPNANQIALAQLWPHFLAFVAGSASSS